MPILGPAAAAALALSVAAPPSTALRPDQTAFHDLYKELVETNTTISAGDCTEAARRMGAHLTGAGYPADAVTVFTAPGHPKEGGLVAVLPGTDAKLKPLLLLAHLDVVEARRADWTRDPFKLVEEDGFFYARGASDDKAMAAVFTDAMVRLHGARPPRTVKLALTCGEETNGVFNGASWLSQNKRDLIDAEFALNEGGGGRLDAQGRPQILSMQVAEKTSQDYLIETRNPGGHSSVPRPDNAIYELAGALTKVQGFRFPVHINPTTHAFFEKTSKLSSVPQSLAQPMAAIAADPEDKLAAAALSREPTFNSTLRTTCVATLLEGGHAQNALPQRAAANINCRIAPGETIEQTRDVLAKLIDDPGVTVTIKPGRGPIAVAAPLDPKVIKPAEALAAEMYPGLPVIPNMSTGATDSIYLSAVGIPSYGVPGILYEADGGGVHGLNEHMRQSSLYKGRDYLYRLIRIYAGAKG